MILRLDTLMFHATPLFLLFGVVVRNGVLGAVTVAGENVDCCACCSRPLVEPFGRMSSGKVAILSGSSALFRASTVPM